jgi:clathrin heavy chain
LALRAKKQDNANICVLQVFDMESRKKLKSLEVNENIVFWKWVNNDILAYVTSSSVYHINIKNDLQDSVKIMDRNGPLIDD